MSSSVEVSVVIVSHGNAALTRTCLGALLAGTARLDCEVIVVDNASSDGTAEMVRRDFPAVQLIALEQNVGFARGCNLGAGRAGGEFLLLLNPDTVVHDDAVQRLVALARARPQGGLYGGRTLTPRGALDPRSCWGAPTLWSTFCFAAGLSTLFRRSALLDPESLGRWPRDTVREVDVIAGSLLLLRRTLWERLGGFDPAFFMYGEDVDLALRARTLGYRPLITPAATVTHVGGASSPRRERTVLILRGKATLMRKHWSPGRRRLGLLLLWLGTGLRALVGGPAGMPSSGGEGASAWRHAWHERARWSAGYPA